jgi:hypothetical protein
MSRYVSYLIDDVRTSTENTDFSDTVGIKDAEFLRFLNDAQYRIHSKIVQQHPSVFITEYTTSVVGDQEAYSLPLKAMMGNKVTQVEYTSQSSGTQYYYPLRPGSLFQRSSGPGSGSSIGAPTHYIRKGGQILLSPIPTSSNGTLKINYVHKMPRLDLRRGSVASVTLDSSTNTISALSLDVSTDVIDSTELDKFTRLSIVDEEGNVKMSNIKYTAIDSGTGVVTVDSSFTYDTGETISTGNYVVAGPYSTTHVMLDDMVERYLISYCTFKILQRDSNVTDLTTQQNILLEMENEIVQAYAEISDDIMEIPNIVSYDDEWSF